MIMQDQVPNKDRDPAEDGSAMAGQVLDAFHMPWPRKPLGKPTSKGQPGNKSPTAGRRTATKGHGRPGRSSHIGKVKKGWGWD
jgi:hypothetical protein